MIEKCRDYCYLYCDVCGKEVDDTVFYDFHDAVDYKKKHGWKSQRHNGEWEDVCPECQGV